MDRFFFVKTGYLYIRNKFVTKMLALSKAKIASTTGGGSTKTAKGKLRLDPILANASAH